MRARSIAAVGRAGVWLRPIPAVPNRKHGCTRVLSRSTATTLATPCLQSDVSMRRDRVDLARQLSVSSREVPRLTPANGTLMARRSLGAAASACGHPGLRWRRRVRRPSATWDKRTTLGHRPAFCRVAEHPACADRAAAGCRCMLAVGVVRLVGPGDAASISIGEWLVADQERVLGTDHRDTAAVLPADDASAALQKLAGLHDSGLPSDDEFAAKRAEIIERI